MSATQPPSGPAAGARRDGFAGAFASRDNALGAVRLGLAAAVVASHAFLTTGDDSAFTQLVGFWAVNGFFALSGYLIADSRMRLRLGRFLWHRALRILPAFWVVLVVVAFVIAPVTVLLTGERWDAGSAAGYVLRNAGLWITQTGIDETLRSVPHGIEWNAPLWTLAHEAACYLAAGLALSIGVVRRHPLPWIAAAMVALMAGNLLAHGALSGSVSLVGLHALRLGGYFAAGMLVWALRDRLPVRWWLAAACAIGLVALQFAGISGWVGQPLFAYLVLWFGARLPVRVGPADVSYGLYVWAFPLQQVAAAAGVAALGAPAAFLIVVVPALGLAWLSWRFVERPALALTSMPVPSRRHD